MMKPDSASGYYQSRFTHEPKRAATWRIICGYLQRFLPPEARVLEIGAGYCAFINQIDAREKHALDLYPGFVEFAARDVRTRVGSCDDLSAFASDQFDTVFASNLLEHLTREQLHATLEGVRRVLKPGGRFLVVQPNFRYAYREYFDDYTHLQIFTHRALADLLAAHGFSIEIVEPRFIPFSFKSHLPKWSWLVKLYLALPLRPFAGQMLVVAHK